jgi:hypothetical protein
MTVALPVPRELLAKYFGQDPRLLNAFEAQAQVVAEHSDVLSNSVAATGALNDATVVTLSKNDAFDHEYVLTPGDGTDLNITSGSLKIDVDPTVVRSGGPQVTLNAQATVTLALPHAGTIISDKDSGALVAAANDAAAASAGVPIGGIYQASGVLHVRLT